MAVKKIYGGVFIGLCMAFCIICIQAPCVEGAAYSIAVDVNQQSGQWNRFYEQLISTDHVHDMLSSAYGRNMQNALRRGVTECGFKYFRGHGIFNSDIGLYSEPNGVPTYNWSKFDSVYDAAHALGIRPSLEFSFTPTAIATNLNSTTLWYNNAAANTSIPKDWNKWRDLCDSVVVHCEARYGVDEVRKWFFEVYNEPNLGSFFSGTQQDYFKLFDYASEGVRRADSLCKVGGPSTAGVDTDFISAFLQHVTTGTNFATGAIGSKCDFVAYHRYATDPAAKPTDASGSSVPQSENDYHKDIVDICKGRNFNGLIINNEWGLSAYPITDRETEKNASYAVKTIHLLISNGAAYPPPYMYGYWCMSDIYEEYNAWAVQRVTAFDNPGNYGICLRGDPNITDSYDVGKPVFNAFKLLHQMGDVQISCTGGIVGNGPNAFATISKDTSAVQIMIYTHTSVFKTDNITLTVSNIPFANAHIEHFIVDSARSNAFRAWQGMGSPAAPNAAQWAQLKAAANLAYFDSVKTVPITGSTYTVSFAQSPYSVSLVRISDTNRIAAVRQPNNQINSFVNRFSAEIKNNDLYVGIPMPGQHNIALFNVKGAMVFNMNVSGLKTTVIPISQLRKGTYVLRCGSGPSALTTKVVFCK